MEAKTFAHRGWRDQKGDSLGKQSRFTVILQLSSFAAMLQLSRFAVILYLPEALYMINLIVPETCHDSIARLRRSVHRSVPAHPILQKP